MSFLPNSGQGGEQKSAHPDTSTFSIAACDPETGEIGVAVQSKIVSVGSIVPFAQAGVGAIATQAAANVGYGPAGLQLLKMGTSPEKTIELMTAVDPFRDIRQIGIVTPDGRAASFTGTECNAAAGHRTGKNYAVQGNLLADPKVIDAIADAFEKAEGELGARMIAALRAGQAAGGDKRGKQSAALLIVREGWGYGYMNDRYRDIRVDDHEEPIEELARVYELHKAMFRAPKVR